MDNNYKPSPFSIQKKLDRVRPPRVVISYDFEAGAAIEKRELPFVVGVLANLSSSTSEVVRLRERKFIDIDWDNFDDVMARLKPSLAFKVENTLSNDPPLLQVQLAFSKLGDFEPEAIVGQVEPLKTLLEERGRCAGERDDDDLISDEAASRIRAIDQQLSAQLNAILHAEPFQTLEASWRGLKYLVSESETSARIRIRVLSVSKQELSRDLYKAVDFDQSTLFKKVYDEEYGAFGGVAFDVLLGDFEFGRTSGDVELLSKIAAVAAASHAPFLAAAGPDLLNLSSFSELSYPRMLSAVFDTVEYANWRAFRNSQDSMYVALTLPRMLLRIPYGSETNPVEAFDFCETVERHGDYLWGNSAYALGCCLTRAFAQYGWCAAIRGVEGGGIVEGLPVLTFTADDGEIAVKCPTEIAITDRREKELADLGFVPLIHLKGTDYAAFFTMQTCCKPKSYDNVEGTANARLLTQLQYVLTTSRFAHYLKVITRDRIGSFVSRSQCEDLLNRWISNYVLPESDSASVVTKARYPLSEARVDVVEHPGKPGMYRAVVFLRPHFQLDELSISMRLALDLPAAATR